MASIILEVAENTAIIKLNRPEKYNAFNREMALDLQIVLDECTKQPMIRAIYLTGNGKAFSAGQDISELVSDNAPGFEQILAEQYNPIIQRIRNIEKPVVCAVNGVAAGAGANIALCCDIVVAKKQASFIQAFSKIGLIPDSGGTYFLPRLIGFQKASALMMLGDVVTADEAERLGMLYKVFDEDGFEKESLSIAHKLSRMPTQALALTKKALNASFTHTLEQQLHTEDLLQNAAAKTEDYAEGIRSFIEKRQPIFKGC